MRVDFYVLPGDTPAAREHFCCRLAEKAWREGLRVVILATDGPAAARLDEALWTFREGSFVPHALAREADTHEPVIITTEAPPTDRDMLINVTDRLPDPWQAYERVAEIVIQAAEVIGPARARFRSYRDAGVTPTNHTLGSG
ncbi:DNA polymerase III subunit chi [Arhodomonas sp. AD133]|uniref:DNA polymerase III subunit chi n=1 Tax=Arhodomonas sp. AD133 TaxID=3415009 RepID=UPI003EBEF964